MDPDAGEAWQGRGATYGFFHGAGELSGKGGTIQRIVAAAGAGLPVTLHLCSGAQRQ